MKNFFLYAFAAWGFFCLVIIITEASKASGPSSYELTKDEIKEHVEYACRKWPGEACGYLLGGSHRK